MRGECFMCGKEDQPLKGCWYVYDNGEQNRAMACPSCVDVHDRTLKVKS